MSDTHMRNHLGLSEQYPAPNSQTENLNILVINCNITCQGLAPRLSPETVLLMHINSGTWRKEEL